MELHFWNKVFHPCIHWYLDGCSIVFLMLSILPHFLFRISKEYGNLNLQYQIKSNANAFVKYLEHLYLLWIYRFMTKQQCKAHLHKFLCKKLIFWTIVSCCFHTTLLPNAHHHWRAGNDEFAKGTLTPNYACATVARPCESSIWCGWTKPLRGRHVAGHLLL